MLYPEATTTPSQPNNALRQPQADSGQQNGEQVMFALERLQRDTTNPKIAIVLDNAGFHHAKAVTDLYQSGQLLERITPIYLPPYAPDHNPTEHVWNAAKAHIANLQHATPDETFTAFMSYLGSRTFDYDFEHLPITRKTDLV